jgi:phosphatidylglycerophosphatase C
MSRQPCHVAVFDLDDTLVHGDSFALFTRHLLFRQRWRAVLALLSAPVLWPMLFVPATRRAAVGALLWIASVGLSEAEFTALAKRFAATHADRPIQLAMDRLRQHLHAGDRVVIVTACAEPLASAVCAELGLLDVEIIAAQLRHRRAAMHPALGCRGDQKVDRLRDAGITLPVDYAYTDSAVDLPLLQVATHPYLVQPSTRHLDRVQAVLGNRVTVLPASTTP